MRPPRLVPLYLLLLFPILTASRQAIAFQWEANDQRPTSSAAALQGQPTPDEVRGILKAIGPGEEYTSEFAGAAGRGAGVDSQGEKIDQQHTGSPPLARLEGVGSGEGGGSSTTLHALSGVSPNTQKAVGLGLALLCLVAAIVSVAKRWNLPPAPIVFGGGAVVFAVLAFVPLIWMFYGLCGIVVLAIIDKLFGVKSLTAGFESARAAFGAAAKLGEEGQREFLAAYSSEADRPSDAETARKIVFRDGLNLPIKPKNAV